MRMRNAASDGGPPEPSPVRLSYRKAELPALTGLPLRSLERALAAGTFPGPDRRVGRVGLWYVDTLRRWLAGEVRR